MHVCVSMLSARKQAHVLAHIHIQVCINGRDVHFVRMCVCMYVCMYVFL